VYVVVPDADHRGQCPTSAGFVSSSPLLLTFCSLVTYIVNSSRTISMV
jgi:hypothetical protein